MNRSLPMLPLALALCAGAAGCTADVAPDDVDETASGASTFGPIKLPKCLFADRSGALPFTGFHETLRSRTPEPTRPFVDFDGCPIVVSFDQLQAGTLGGKPHLHVNLSGDRDGTARSQWQVTIRARKDTWNGNAWVTTVDTLMRNEVILPRDGVSASAFQVSKVLDLAQGYTSIDIQVNATGRFMSNAGHVSSFFGRSLPVRFDLHFD